MKKILFEKMTLRSIAWSVLSLFLVLGMLLRFQPTDSLFAQKSTAKVAVSAEEFVQSEAGQLLQSGQYDQALGALNQLLEDYPNDELLIRYKGIVLDRLGRSDEAIAIFKDLISENPTHVPTHFFLAQAYENAGQRDLANQEWRFVAENGDGTPYEAWAHSALAMTGQMKYLAHTPATQNAERWNVYARYGFEYDSNIILNPNDSSLESARDQDGARQVLDFALRYRAYSKRDLVVDLKYAMRQTLHTDSFDELNFHTEKFQINLRKRMKLGDQDFIGGLKYNITLGFLDDDIFYVRNRWILSADTHFSNRTRTVFYDRMTIGEYGPDGTDRRLSSRDGFYNDFGITHYMYSEDFSKYIYITQEFNSAHTEGDNFDRIGTLTRLGLHMPLFDRLDLDASTSLRFRLYHNFQSRSARDLSKRRGTRFDIYTALTYHITSRLGLRAFYRYIDADNQNNFYDYNRHTTGTHLIYSQSF